MSCFNTVSDFHGRQAQKAYTTFVEFWLSEITHLHDVVQTGFVTIRTVRPVMTWRIFRRPPSPQADILQCSTLLADDKLVRIHDHSPTASVWIVAVRQDDFFVSRGFGRSGQKRPNVQSIDREFPRTWIVWVHTGQVAKRRVPVRGVNRSSYCLSLHVCRDHSAACECRSSYPSFKERALSSTKRVVAPSAVSPTVVRRHDNEAVVPHATFLQHLHNGSRDVVCHANHRLVCLPKTAGWLVGVAIDPVLGCLEWWMYIMQGQIQKEWCGWIVFR